MTFPYADVFFAKVKSYLNEIDTAAKRVVIEPLLVAVSVMLTFVHLQKRHDLYVEQ